LAKVKLKKTKPQTIAYIEHTGAYDKVPYEAYVEKLIAWARVHNVSRRPRPIAILLKNPDYTPDDRCKSEIGIPVKATAKGDGEVKVRQAQPALVISVDFKDSPERLLSVMEIFEEYAKDNGYDFIGPVTQVFKGKPKQVNGKMVLHCELTMAVRKSWGPKAGNGSKR